MKVVCYLVAGLLAGVAAGMGMGGGTLLIPALTLLCGLEQHAAQGVNLLAFLPAASVALYIHAKEKRLEVKKSLPILLAGVAGALPGAWLSGLLGAWLRRGFGGFLLLLCLLRLIGARRAK